MSLPSPNLDNRKFQDFVDDAKRQIGLRCPEWTEHNVSDPGVTLIELFAWMTEGIIYRLNQVPEKNYIEFLELLGTTLESAAPAQTELCFRLSRPIEDNEESTSQEHVLKAYETVAATIRTETEDAIEFVLESDLRMVRPRLASVFSASSTQPGEGDRKLTNIREFKSPVDDIHGETSEYEDMPNSLVDLPEHRLNIFGTPPEEGDSLYLGFDSDISSNLIELEVVCYMAAATGHNEDYPSQVWEYWNNKESCWRRIPLCVIDTTYGFSRNGRIELLMPSNFLPSVLNNRQARWLRCRYTTSPVDLPPIGPQRLRPAQYQKSPEIYSLTTRTLGGGTTASNSVVECNEVLGQSNELPGQVFKLKHSSILPRRQGEALYVGPEVSALAVMTQWTEVADFSESKSTDRHFVCDSYTGEIFLGPNIPQPDGSTVQHGAVPAKGLTLKFSAYRHGGGVHGNVRENQVAVLKSSIPYISEVWNPRPATGGKDQENIERAKLRARQELRIRERAVTAEDYEFLSCRASSSVGRAHCIQPGPRYSSGQNLEDILPGTISVLLVPALSDAITVPRPNDLRIPQRVLNEVRTYLDERRMLTAVLQVGEPDYVYVSTDLTIVADPKADADHVAKVLRERLEKYIHPLTGGATGDGWPFRRALTLADIYAQVGSIPGVAFLLDAKIFSSKVANQETGQLSQEKQISIPDGVRLAEQELICTREHRVHVRPIWTVGMDDMASIKE